VDRAKKFHICKATKKRIEINDKDAVFPSILFDTVPEKEKSLHEAPCYT
jgi:hypothetical protein